MAKTISHNSVSHISISNIELDVVQLLLEHGKCSVAELEEYLSVTATAVRQRLKTLMAAGLIDRSKETEGRGRPTHRYWLTDAGRKVTGNNLSDLASALWQEVQKIPDEGIRQTVMAGVANRLANDFGEFIEGESAEQRLHSLANLMGQRDIPVSIESRDGQPTLKILACPFPDLADDNRDVCEIEQKLISKVVGGTLERCQCSKDGDNCCSYQTTKAK